jgi:hypothetical protein
MFDKKICCVKLMHSFARQERLTNQFHDWRLHAVIDTLDQQAPIHNANRPNGWKGVPDGAHQKLWKPNGYEEGSKVAGRRRTGKQFELCAAEFVRRLTGPLMRQGTSIECNEFWMLPVTCDGFVLRSKISCPELLRQRKVKCSSPRHSLLTFLIK